MEQPEPAPKKWPDSAFHVLRTAQAIHVQHSALADQKASILIGATFVVFTLVLTKGLQGGGTLATAILAGSSFLSALFGVLAVMPGHTRNRKPSNNPLFFGSFVRMSEDEYVEAMMDNIKDTEATFRMQLHDLYQNGAYLAHKKFRYLRLAFYSFLTGLVLSFTAYLFQLLAG